MWHTQVWQDEQRQRAGDTRHLVLWRPVAPAGYVAVGMLAGLGALPPAVNVMRQVSYVCPVHTILTLTIHTDKLSPLRCHYPPLFDKFPDTPHLNLPPFIPSKSLRSKSVHTFIRCVRIDAALSTTIQRNTPSWVHPEYRQRTAVYGWTTDERNSAFIAMSQVWECSHYSPSPHIPPHPGWFVLTSPFAHLTHLSSVG